MNMTLSESKCKKNFTLVNNNFQSTPAEVPTPADLLGFDPDNYTESDDLETTGGGLGILTSKSDTPGDKPDYQSQKHRRDIYRLRKEARRLLPEERVKDCGHNLAWGFNHAELSMAKESGKAFVRNIAVCGSVWMCPVCAERLALQRRDELERAIEIWRDMGGYCYHVTLTVSHQAHESFDDVSKRFRGLRSQFVGQRPYRAFKESVGFEGIAQNLEVTHGANGWHIHGHGVIFATKCVTGSELEQLENGLQWGWVSHCRRKGAYATNNRGLTLNLVDSPGKAANYLTKWHVSNDMMSVLSKKAKGESLTVWELLADSMAGNEESGKLFREYAFGSKGLHQIWWTPGLKDKIGLNDEPEAEAEAEIADESVETIGLISWLHWHYIADKGLQLALLQLTEDCRGDFETIAEWFDGHGLKLFRPCDLDLVATRADVTVIQANWQSELKRYHRENSASAYETENSAGEYDFVF